MRIEAYAVICENDCIADANGKMPDALKTDAEWAFFQAGLDASDVIVLGRKSHDVTPNPKQRRRLVLTSSVETPAWDEDNPLTVFWNPAHARLELAVSMFEVNVSVLAITGGRQVFDHFLEREPGYTHFHLSRVQDVYLQGGTKVFSALEGGGNTPESLLKSRGYTAGKWQQLDKVSSVVSWVSSV